MTKKQRTRARLGITVFTEGLGLIRKNPGLLKYGLYSLILSILVFIGTGFLAFWCYQTWGVEYIEQLNWGNWGSVLKWLSYVTLVLGYLVLSFFTFSALSTLICIPIMDSLSISVERLTWDRVDEAPFWVGLRKGIKSATIMFIIRMTVMIVALPLLLIPVVGAVAYFLINAWYAAYDFIDVPMGRRGWRMRRKKQFLAKSSGAQMFFGSIAYLGTLIPFLNLLMVFLGTIAGTLLFIRISEESEAIVQNDSDS